MTASHGAAPREPAPGLGRLPELAGQAASAGLRGEVSVDGTAYPLPPGADLAAFRTIQEVLTNIVRHSQARVARVRIGYLPEGVDCGTVRDAPDHRPAPPGRTNKSGCSGLAQRSTQRSQYADSHGGKNFSEASGRKTGILDTEPITRPLTSNRWLARTL
jgi:hypothetical protein